QPTQVLVHMPLGQLRGLPGGSAAEGTWAAARASQPGWVTGPDAEAAACDATVVPVVTGHVDWTALDRLLDAGPATPPPTPGPRRAGPPADGAQPAGPEATAGASGPGSRAITGGGAPTGGPAPGAPPTPGRQPLSPATRDRLRRALLALATDALS